MKWAFILIGVMSAVIIITGMILGGQTFALILRTVAYLGFIFLIAFDVPLTHGAHRLVLFAMIFWLSVLIGSTIVLGFGYTQLYMWLRDYISTLGVLGVVIVHVYWLNQRNKTPKI